MSLMQSFVSDYNGLKVIKDDNLCLKKEILPYEWNGFFKRLFTGNVFKYREEIISDSMYRLDNCLFVSSIAYSKLMNDQTIKYHDQWVR